ncbi:hypothetical protein KNP414_01627 [Paenibacillus mucilaginosus KNP414]|uniref:Uncharacterized protein n=1 Tax=Paenibacillus mucilaginosus (strain KNP414) TaxID=1036673 RepID=F8FPG6_PAEMK|nr:hypothetical protein KNP414_01627 [Paenibacillus mucilaginosus KNP414]
MARWTGRKAVLLFVRMSPESVNEQPKSRRLGIEACGFY